MDERPPSDSRFSDSASQIKLQSPHLAYVDLYREILGEETMKNYHLQAASNE